MGVHTTQYRTVSTNFQKYLVGNNSNFKFEENSLCQKKRAPRRIQVGQNGPQKRKKAVLRIRDVYPGSDFSPSRFRRSKNLSILTPKKWFLSSSKYDPGGSSRIRILTFYPSRIPDPRVKKAPDPGSKGQKGPGSGSATLEKRENFIMGRTLWRVGGFSWSLRVLL